MNATTADHIAGIQAYAASIGHDLTDQKAGLVASLASLAPERPSVDDLDSWIARFAA